MVVRMVANGMSLVNDAGKKLGMFSHIIPDAKKGRLDAVRFKQIKHPRRLLRNRAVIKREVDDLASGIASPKRAGKQQTDKKRRLDNPIKCHYNPY